MTPELGPAGLTVPWSVDRRRGGACKAGNPVDQSPFLVRQRVKLHGQFGGYFEHVVDHDVHRVAAFRKKVDGRA